MKYDVVLSGRVTGNAGYREQFAKVAAFLRGRDAAARVFNPAELPEGRSEAWYMVRLDRETLQDAKNDVQSNKRAFNEAKCLAYTAHVIDVLGWVVDTLKHHHMKKPGISTIIKEVDRRMKHNAEGQGRREATYPELACSALDSEEPEDREERCDSCGETNRCLMNGLCPMCYELNGGTHD